jgi:hypothetical protein
MNTNFNHLPWHDACLKFIYIDRQNPGENDVVKILVDWPEEQGSSYIEFSDCYAFKANMNFGIVACESILFAKCFTDSEVLNSIRKEWSTLGVDLKELKCFEITTNSTNSIISIYALNFKITNQ